ncbi:MAG: trehalose-6-phosphate synthase [Omnitrophica bacterium RIFCSPHIGHO2_02_FULL_46_11]|nr:MAG: trehalose-6-phosphate synthase [Omnitrophica bacterium RIFCSPLOWO2_01_FULL_45_10b]OGW87873.1 MAG: trehalose-6-phosphate synthase [Omnitrophica bacterium RIFCSPHIGHO2_02_FULL_46_11]
MASNRQPYSHVLKSGKIICQRQPGGLVTAMNPVMQAVRGTWIAAGTSPYDRQVLDEQHKVKLPPENPSYSLRRLFLSKEETNEYYYGYCNSGLWPLCHISYTRPVFLTSDWKAYQKINEQFAQAILEEVGSERAFVWVQDYHLALVGKYLKEANRPNLITSLFWHIPWPNPETFRICPHRRELLEGFLAYDLLGFQIRYHCDNFLAAVDLELESRIDREKISVNYQNKETFIRAFPISVDFQAIEQEASSNTSRDLCEKIREDFSIGDKKLLVGVDRVDYTKGLPDRFRAIDRFLEKYPQYKEKFVFFQLGQISRLHMPRYKQLNDEISALVEGINWKHSQGSWVPIILMRSYMSYQEILALYRMADACIVSSLHDGMNLVAKEFVAARSDADGVLILSQFTGASRELPDALLINPYDYESFADTIAQALELPKEERERRMRKMREAVEQNNIYRWAGKVLSQLLKFEFQET